MKKYMIMCMAVVALLIVSCKKEDISISREVVFEVNPYTVISDFAKHEVKSGDLEKLDPIYKLRITLLVYNTMGELEGSEIQLIDDYRSTMSTTIELADGEYTIVALSDVTDRNEQNDDWKVSGINRLSDLRIAEQNHISDKTKILGIGYAKVSVMAGHSTHSILMKPAGSLFIVHDNQVHQYYDVLQYLIYADKGSNSLTFNNDGSFVSHVDESLLTYDWKLHVFNDPFSSNHLQSENWYSYHFSLSLGYTNFAWVANVMNDDGSTQLLMLDDPLSGYIEQGKVYEFQCLCNSLSWELQEYSDGKSSLALGDEKLEIDKNKECSINESNGSFKK